jgi:hypothetical protein
MKQCLLFTLLLCLALLRIQAQFAPAAGMPGSTAIFKDDPAFIGWAADCHVQRGLQVIDTPSYGYASVGDSASAIGAGGENGVVSLGDGGMATCTFHWPIINGPGYDFAVFENSFRDDYLELAFVEVSSDGIHFLRFPATCNTQDTLQLDGFGLSDPTQINNLAGKYRALYGTPFDLEELKDSASLDVNNITHVRIIDVVGNIRSPYATYDKNNRAINDPWPTPYPSSGFDLDAVGVIHATHASAIEKVHASQMPTLFPNPVEEMAFLTVTPETWVLLDMNGKPCLQGQNTGIINAASLSPGIYILQVQYAGQFFQLKFIKA